MTVPTVVIPIRTFRGMSRLSTVLSAAQRVDVSRRLVRRLLEAVEANDLPMLVVTSDEDVASLVSDHAAVVGDPGKGLDGAATVGVSHCPGPWLLIHADLPLVDRRAIRSITDLADGERVVLVPSADGGTTVIAGAGPFPFAFGPGSFHRHLAGAPDARIVADPRLSVDLDTPAQFRALRRYLDGA